MCERDRGIFIPVCMCTPRVHLLLTASSTRLWFALWCFPASNLKSSDANAETDKLGFTNALILAWKLNPVGSNGSQGGVNSGFPCAVFSFWKIPPTYLCSYSNFLRNIEKLVQLQVQYTPLALIYCLKLRRPLNFIITSSMEMCFPGLL